MLNNADRKAGHLLPLPDGRIQGIDNGLCFAVEPKLRTVLWRWRGQPLTDDERAVLARLREELAGDLGDGSRRSWPRTSWPPSRRDRGAAEDRRLARPDRNRPAVPWPPY